ncbi:DUF2304 domain-containing protein [Streptomyces luteoverticillatus]|uniref:DUF2304 domain-containing protein n=1 Tax=Streptomyces luteoverticillatus TaxID=66425 RepID=A0A3S9PME0_STRLT|nr:DUF2304 domain-containing protein [Streptomyces luteoverticillatus]AZQ73550.1 DUF2304 domain-containing protein [Streptomyces luteoverticillatus]
MALSVSVVVLLAIVTLLLLRSGQLRVGHAVVTALLGFYLAQTGIAPAIHRMVASCATALSNLAT